MKRAILASTSTLFNQDYLEYLIPNIDNLYKNIEQIVFIPYARPGGISLDDYTNHVQEAFNQIDIEVKGIHQFDNAKTAIENAKGIFTGGGNTFLLVSELYRNNVMPILKEVVFQGVPYLGTSAGTNIAGLTMQTTNDMPIVYPPSFKTLGVVPFNINPHYLDPNKNSTHKGETRETRIKEFHSINTQPVLGLREGSWLDITDNKITLKGDLKARLFEVDKVPFEIETNTNLSHLK